MPAYTYKIVPAPERARKIRGAKGPEARFAATLEEDLNAIGEDGWEFLRTETFSVEERSGLTGKKQVDRQVLVFRKALEEPAVDVPPLTLRAAPERAPEEADPEPEEAKGPRILGRPVPPVTRLQRDAALRSETD